MLSLTLLYHSVLFMKFSQQEILCDVSAECIQIELNKVITSRHGTENKVSWQDCWLVVCFVTNYKDFACNLKYFKTARGCIISISTRKRKSLCL